MNVMPTLRRLPLSFLPLTLFLVGCQSKPITRSEARPDFSLSNFQTYHLSPVTSSFSSADPGAAIRLGEPLSAAVKSRFANLGLTETNPQEAALIAVLRTDSSQSIEVRDWGRRRSFFYHERGPFLYGTQDLSITERTNSVLALDLYDASSMKLVWVGWLDLWGKISNIDPVELTVAFEEVLNRLGPAETN
ncbi:MAG: DUF4136 domain-containing protein [Puniceicoccaceae bacterium]